MSLHKSQYTHTYTSILIHSLLSLFLSNPWFPNSSSSIESNNGSESNPFPNTNIFLLSPSNGQSQISQIRHGFHPPFWFQVSNPLLFQFIAHFISFHLQFSFSIFYFFLCYVDYWLFNLCYDIELIFGLVKWLLEWFDCIQVFFLLLCMYSLLVGEDIQDACLVQ